MQLLPALGAGVRHPDECAQKPNPPCFVQRLRLLTDLDVHSAIQHLALPPPCLQQRRPLLIEGVLQPTTEHGLFFFPPPCFRQCLDPARALVVHPPNWHVPYAPCLLQTPRACARVLQPSILHTFVLLTPPCLTHLPPALTAVAQLSKEQNPLAPCLPQTPRALAAESHPAVEQNPFAPCFVQSPRATALVPQPSAEQATFGLVSCFAHIPRARAVVMQPSIEHGPL